MLTRTVVTKDGARVRLRYHRELLDSFYEPERTNVNTILNGIVRTLADLLRRGA